MGRDEDGWDVDTDQPSKPEVPRRWYTEVSFSSLIDGDWRSAALPVLLAVVAMLGSSLVLFLLVGSGEAGVGANLVLIFGTVALAFGGTVTASAGGFVGLAFSQTVMPLGVSVVGVSIFYWLFTRSLRSTGPTLGRAALVLHVARTLSVLFGVLVAVALLGSQSVTVNSGTNSARMRTSVDIVATVWWGLFWTALIISVAVLVNRSDLVPAAVSRRWAAAGPPLVAAAATLAGAMVLTLFIVVGYVLLHPKDAEVLPIALVYLPNVAWMALGLGLGVPLEGSASGALSAFLPDTTGGATLTDLTQISGWIWLLPVAAAGLLLVGSVMGALRAPSPKYARRNGPRFGIAFAALMLLAAVLSRVSAGGASAFTGELSGSLHLSYVLAPLLALLWGAIAGIVGARLAVRLPVALRRGLRRRLGGYVGLEVGPPVAGPNPEAGAPPA